MTYFSILESPHKIPGNASKGKCFWFLGNDRGRRTRTMMWNTSLWFVIRMPVSELFQAHQDKATRGPCSNIWEGKNALPLSLQLVYRDERMLLQIFSNVNAQMKRGTLGGFINEKLFGNRQPTHSYSTPHDCTASASRWATLIRKLFLLQIQLYIAQVNSFQVQK